MMFLWKRCRYPTQLLKEKIERIYVTIILHRHAKAHRPIFPESREMQESITSEPIEVKTEGQTYTPLCLFPLTLDTGSRNTRKNYMWFSLQGELAGGVGEGTLQCFSLGGMSHTVAPTR
jgi:hypothetical protein